jgi:tRNA (mo5U34)-methyltransferase
LTLAERIAGIEWYHSIDLGSGVVTPGWFDTRAAAAKVPLPARLDGTRCLDVGTWDGFWAFEMERRGAHEVVAIDVLDPARWDWPAKTRGGMGVEVLRAVKGASEGFAVARDALGSRVEREDLSVYDLDPQRHGTFDVVFLGSLLLHLRDPVGALERIRAVTAGRAVIADSIELVPTLIWPRTPVARLDGGERPWWWQPNRAALLRMVRSAGFLVEHATRPYFVPTGPGHPRPPLRTLPPRLRTAQGREEIVAALAGVPHVAVLAR